MKRIVLLIALLGALSALVAITACSEFDLKTRDDIRNAETSKDKKPASTAPSGNNAAAAPEKEDPDAQMRALNAHINELRELWIKTWLDGM